ncbi:hypothetical protein REPUB_Repub01dG0133300 [Reevesia pubescens]
MIGQSGLAAEVWNCLSSKHDYEEQTRYTAEHHVPFLVLEYIKVRKEQDEHHVDIWPRQLKQTEQSKSLNLQSRKG